MSIYADFCRAQDLADEFAFWIIRHGNPVTDGGCILCRPNIPDDVKRRICGYHKAVDYANERGINVAEPGSQSSRE